MDDYFPIVIFSYLGGAAGDALRNSNGLPFSTYDSDLDNFKGNCAQK